LRAWNEWAEGNYMEPDEEFGTGRLEALKRSLEAFRPDANAAESLKD